MDDLSSKTLSRVPKSIRVPNYDRDEFPVGLAHIGVGAFHRCHQAEYTDDALEAGTEQRMAIGINLRPPSIEAQLAPQDGLYTRTLVDGDDRETRVIGCIRQTIDAFNNLEPALTAIGSETIDTVTMTVTEKGYCHIPATGALDPDHPDILADLRDPSRPTSLPGFLAEALNRRRWTGAGITLVSCDNIPSNGEVLSAVTLSFAEQRDPALASWIRDNVRFPSTMVDRIVPATQSSDLDAVAGDLGLTDRGAVVGEPFRQWVIEDTFHGSRPGWEAGGAVFATDIRRYEIMKMRVLNAAQSSMSYFGALAGLEFTFEDARDPVIRNFVDRMLREETASTLLPVADMPFDGYVELTFKRLLNDAVHHRNHQVATDGSQKLNQRLLQSIRDRQARGLPSPLLSTAVAAWITYIARSLPEFGAHWRADDAVMPFFQQAGRDSGGNIQAFCSAVLANRPVIGAQLGEDAVFADTVATRCADLLNGDPRDVLESVLGSA